MSQTTLGFQTDTKRISLLVPGLIRMEYAPDGCFEDRKSLRALTRPPVIPFSEIRELEDRVMLLDEELVLELRDDGRPFSDSSICINDRTGRLIWQPSSVDTQNLGGVHRSLDQAQLGRLDSGVHPADISQYANDETASLGMMLFDGAGDPDAKTCISQSFPPSLLSKSGYFLYNDSSTQRLDENGWLCKPRTHSDYQDLYLFYYGSDYQHALELYGTLFGRPTHIPRYMFGLWYSRFPTFNADNLKQQILTFQQEDLPLDVLVLDLEWHQRGWHGFDWNLDHIPKPDEFLATLRKQGIHTTLNLHPDAVPVNDTRFPEFMKEAKLDENTVDISEDRRNGEPLLRNFNIGDPDVASAYFNVFHKPVQDQGIDFWWQDGGAHVEQSDSYNQLWTNHWYYRQQVEHYPDRRPMIFSRASGLGSHRYPIQFTGDAHTQWEVLRHEIEYTLRAGHMGCAHVSHDIGGFFSEQDPPERELYARWVQFGALSPIFRLHSAKGGERRPWKFDTEVKQCFKQAFDLRCSLLPELYTLSWLSGQNCLPICRSNILQLPHWLEGQDIFDAYFIGDRIYAAPLLEPGTQRKVLLPPGDWYRFGTEERITSNGRSTICFEAPLDDIPLCFIKAGSLLLTQESGVQAGRIPEKLRATWYAGAADCSDLHRLHLDDGYSRSHESGEYAQLSFTTVQESDHTGISISLAEGSVSQALPPEAFDLHIVGNPIMTSSIVSLL